MQRTNEREGDLIRVAVARAMQVVEREVGCKVDQLDIEVERDDTSTVVNIRLTIPTADLSATAAEVDAEAYKVAEAVGLRLPARRGGAR